MECLETLQSFEAITRLVAEYDTVSGCGNIRTKGAVLLNPLDCDTNIEGELTLLNRLLDYDVPAVHVASANVALAALCSTYTLRVDCAVPPSLLTMLREVIGYTAAGDMVIRTRKVTGVASKCEDECDVHTLLTRIASTFVTASDKTYALTVQDTTGDPLICDNAEVSWLTLLAASLMPVGTCNMWAWKVSTP